MDHPIRNAWHWLIANVAQLRRRYPVAGHVVSIAVPLFVPVLLSFGGSRWGLVQDAVLTPWGYVLLSVCTLVSVAFAAAQDQSETDQADLEKLAMSLLRLNQSTWNIFDNKANTLAEVLTETLHDAGDNPPRIVSDPKGQLKTLAKELSDCLRAYLWPGSVHTKQPPFVSIVYTFPKKGRSKWYWATPEGEISLRQLLRKDEPRISTLRALLDSEADFVFENSKQKAFDEKRYIRDRRDRVGDNGELKGSIACYRGSIKDQDHILIDFVISVSTYEYQFVPPCDRWAAVINEVACNINDITIPSFKARVGVELSLLYLQAIREERSR